MSVEKNTASLGFEQKIWEAADTLRGNLNAAEYEGVVLGLIFLKYISDKFEAKYQELLADEYADLYIPLDELFNEAMKTQPEPCYYSADGVHPNENGSAFIGEQYAKAILPLLKDTLQ